MLFLVLNVTDHCAPPGLAHAECSVSALPGERTPLGPPLFRPSRGICLHHAQTIGCCKIGRQARQQMHMVGSATNHNGNGLEPAKNSAQIGMHFGTYSVAEQGRAAGSGEYSVHQNAGESVRHACFLRGLPHPYTPIAEFWARGSFARSSGLTSRMGAFFPQSDDWG